MMAGMNSEWAADAKSVSSPGGTGVRQSPGRETAVFWRAEQLDGLELLRATYITHAFARHAHDTFAIGVIEEGLHTFWWRGANLLTPSGDIVVVNPGEVHTGQAARHAGYTYRMLYPPPDLLQRVADDIQGRAWGIPFFPRPVIHDPDLARLIRGFHLTMEHHASALERQTRLWQALAMLILRHAEARPAERSGGPGYAAVRRARAYLDEHFAEEVSLAQLAIMAEVSPFYLARTFRAQVGVPPHTYLEGVRVARAKSLLMAGHGLARVAFDTGFVDQSHFTHRFKRAVGVTPGHYARLRTVGRSEME
jgi:AraC-like DNA-binding protein